MFFLFLRVAYCYNRISVAGEAAKNPKLWERNDVDYTEKLENWKSWKKESGARRKAYNKVVRLYKEEGKELKIDIELYAHEQNTPIIDKDYLAYISHEDLIKSSNVGTEIRKFAYDLF